MANDIKLPELGENLEGGEVLDVKVAEGDTVSVGQSLIEVEAEKSTVDVPAPEAGRVTKLAVKKGEQIKVGQTICVIEGGATKNLEKEPVPKQPPEQKEHGERRGVSPTSPGERRGVSPTSPGERRGVSPTSPADNGKRDGPGPPAEREPAPPSSERGHLVPASPATRRLARELGVDLTRVAGTAHGGRVTPEDVKAYVRTLASSTDRVVQGPSQAPPLPDFEKWGPIEKKALEPIRRRTAQQMALSWNLIPHVTHHDEADITELDAFRRQQDKDGPKLTVTAFALKACAAALKEFPQFNASLDLPSGQAIYKRYYHIGVAVDTERGLLVPVIRDADRKSIRVLARELAELAERAREKKLTADEMHGGSFTITNLGGLGGTAFTPIINYPEVAILGLARGQLRPVVRDGQIVPRLMLPLSLSYDHRIIDGAAAARFTRRVAEMLEHPLLMLL